MAKRLTAKTVAPPLVRLVAADRDAGERVWDFA
jgi:hypothetical protein